MIKNWKNFNESEDYDDIKPNGLNQMAEGINGLVLIFSPLEEDMVEEWNSDDKVSKWIEEGRLFVSKLSYDSWEIYGLEGDKEVKSYIMKNYSW